MISVILQRAWEMSQYILLLSKEVTFNHFARIIVYTFLDCHIVILFVVVRKCLR